jgi:hypothetical protein
MAILNAQVFDLTGDLKALAETLADMGHHDESVTPEWVAVSSYAGTLAGRYADDTFNRGRFLRAAGFGES